MDGGGVGEFVGSIDGFVVGELLKGEVVGN